MTKETSYGIIKESHRREFFMPRGYRHIKEYEKEILELKEQGKMLREIGERLGFSRKQVHNFISRYNVQQRKTAAGVTIKK